MMVQDTKPRREIRTEEPTRPRYDFEVSVESAEHVPERPDSVVVAMIHFEPKPDKNDNMQRAVRLAWQAADEGAQIIAFTEMFLLEWVFSSEEVEAYRHLADPFNGNVWTPLRTLARDKQVVLVCPFFERGNDDHYYNSALVIDIHGDIAGTYRKRHLPPDNERLHLTPGDGIFSAFQTAYGRVGVYICYDNFFPEGARALALDGADIVFAPSAATEQDAAYKWEVAIAANALANNLPWVRLNRIDPPCYRASFVALASGEVVPVNSDEGFALVEIDYTATDRLRQQWPFMQDRRPDQYQDLVK